MPTELEQAHTRIQAWKRDPVQFVREVFKAEPDAWQVGVLTAFATSQRIAMKAAKGCGKSTVLTWCAWNFLMTRMHPKVVATSITEDNLRDGLWAEMAKWQNKSELLKSAFTWQKQRISAKDHENTWWMSARTWSKGSDTNQQANTLAGIHADNVLFILDEVGGIPDAVMAAAEGGLSTGEDTKLLMAGNPTHLEGPLYRACTSERHLWHVTEITGDPDDPKRSPRINVQWAKDQIAKYGRDNPWVLVNVFGKFPPASLNALLGPDDVSPALGRALREDQFSFAPKILGVDVARFGDDRSVIFARQGLATWTPDIMRGARTEEIVGRVARKCQEWNPDAVFVDGTGGYGAGVIDGLRLARFPVIEVSFAGKANDPRYLNKRAEMYFEMAAWIRGGGSLPNMPELQRELCAPTYWFQNDRFQLEGKEDIKARIGESPDLSDALCLTWAQPVHSRRMDLASMVSGTGFGTAKLRTDDDLE